MASDRTAAKRANLVAARLQWSLQDLPETPTGSSIQSDVSKWLNNTAVTEEDAKQKLRGAAGPVRRNPSSDDDLALGVEASLYGKQGVRTVQRFLWWRKSSSALSRWNSFSSTTSGPSGPLSVMDVLNLWNDDPEEVLLDLGFGCDEPDLSGRIPARFINYQSQARGINLQVFLEAQKNRLDLENPDVSNRFRQLEVLQQVTTAFSSLVAPASTLSPEAQERRRRVGMMFRRASKKSLSQLHNHKSHEPTTPTTPTADSFPCVEAESVQPEPSVGDKKVSLKKLKPGPLETGSLSPLMEEQGAGTDQAHVISHSGQEGPLRPGSLRQGHHLRKRSPGHTTESFEMEEIQSFDDSIGTGSYTGGAENLVRGVVRTNSCQSDSSGFLEEPFTLPQQPSPGPNLIKALSGLSEGSTESQSNERLNSPTSSPPHEPLSHLASTSPILSYDLQSSEIETPPHHDQPPSELESQHVPHRSSSPESQNVPDSHSPSVPSPPLNILHSPSSYAMETDIDSLIGYSEDINTPIPDLSTLTHDSEGVTVPSSQSPSPQPNCSSSELIEKFDSPSGKPQIEKTEASLDPCDRPDFHCPSSENNQRDSVPTIPSPALNIPHSPTLPPMETDIDSLIRNSEDMNTEDRDTLGSDLSTLPHDSEAFSGEPENSQTERTEGALDPCDPLDFHCPSSENNQTESVVTIPSPSLNIPCSPTVPPIETDIDSLIRDSEDIQTEDKDTPSPHLSTLPHDSEAADASTFSPVPSSQSPSPQPNSSFSESIETKLDSSSRKPEISQTERTDGALDPCEPLDLHCFSSENNQRDSVFYDSDEIDFSDIQKEQGVSVQLDDNNPSASSPAVEGSCKLEDVSPTPSPQPPGPSTPDGQSSPSSQPHGLKAPASGGISDMNKQCNAVQGESRSHGDNTDLTAASPVQDVICDKMNRLSDLQRNGESEGEVEGHADSVQTQDTAVYISDTESSAALSEGVRLASDEVCTQTEIDPPVPSCSLDDELSAKTKQVELSGGCETEIASTEDEPSKNNLTLHEVPEVLSKSEEEQNDLIEIESLDLVFETSVDGSDVDAADMDAFLQQLDSEGQVYWAEPVQLSGSTPVITESGSFDGSDGSFGRSMSSGGSAALDSASSTDRYKPSTMDSDQNSRNTTDLSDAPSSLALAPNTSPPKQPDLRPSSRSVSVQMSSSPSSHIVQRKDVPYTIDSKYNLSLPTIRHWDTSSPFRAVQEWTDMQIQRNNLLKKLSQGAVHAIPNEAGISVGYSQTIQRPALIFSSSPSLPLLSNDWEVNDCLPGIGGNYHATSASVDGELWQDRDEDVDRIGSEDEKRMWEGDQTATVTCCCSCDQRRSYNRQCSQGSLPYSLADLEEMMLCLQQFRSVLSNMEDQLSEDQAAVYSDLSDQDRENVRDIEELRRAVKEEAKELEMQLNELAHYYDHSLKMRMDRLLDEQSLLCSQLGVVQPAAASTSPSSAPNRTVATQCCLPSAADVHSEHSWNTDSPRPPPPESESVCNGLGCSPTRANKLDIVGFLQKMRMSQHDLWENK